MIAPGACTAIPGWFPPPHGFAEVLKTFGNITVERTNGTITRPPGWEADNMVTMPIAGAGPVSRIYINKLVLPMFREALAECLALNDGYQVRVLSCFSPRAKRSASSEYSLHSWGVAVDINPDENPALRIQTPADLARRSRTIPDEWVEVFESIGWTWGGHFGGYYDPMHFQYASGY